MREKIEDPAYSAWFVRFNCSADDPTAGCHVPVCDTNYQPPLCSALYHDQEVSARACGRERAVRSSRTLNRAAPRFASPLRATQQTPGFPHGDGDCAPPACDVGGVPVGEYLFDCACGARRALTRKRTRRVLGR